MTTQKKRDSDIGPVAIACGIFTVVLLIIDFTYKNFGGLFHKDSLWFGIPTALSHIALAYAWYKVIKGFNDPNQDYWRKLVLLFAIIPILLIMFHRSEWLGKKEFENTVEKNKAAQQLKELTDSLVARGWPRDRIIINL